MTLRIHMSPTYTTPDQADGGIRRVVDALAAGLPAHDITLVSDPAQADLCAVHGTMRPARDDLPLVTHNHGLYWHEYDWRGRWADDANAACIANMIRADAVTAPSAWVARAIGRGLLMQPAVIYHGVDTDFLTPGESRGYVLWNKARVDPVSDPSALGPLAAALPQTPFVTTFGPQAANVHVTGAMPIDAMRDVVRNASVYLATARETFGIGTLEALACGVPVVGWAIGGQEEIITPETGILVPEGDIEALAAAITTVLAHRDRYSAACRADAETRWTWPARIAQYAALYQQVYATAIAPRPRVSVVITAYNLNRYLADAVRSVLSQDMDGVQCIVVDDGGEERAEDVTRQFDDLRVQTHRIANSGLSAARNYGASLATGRYLLFLDADDMLAPGALRELSDALDRCRDLQIAAGGLAIMTDDGARGNPWPDGVNYRAQLAHLNSLHYAAMWRREAFLRTGGYRARDWRAEDAAHWIRSLSFGLRAEQVTTRATLQYRIRGGSKSQQESATHTDKDGDWTSWFGWRLGANDARQGRQAMDAGIRVDPRRVPFGAPVEPPRIAWPIRHQQTPLVSVIIPVGPGHAAHIGDALDSLLAQSWQDYEAIVINDSGAALDLSPWPWVRLVETPGATGAGAARNAGLTVARAPLILWLDADDILTANALMDLLTAYADSDASYTYGGWIVARPSARIADLIRADARAMPVYRDDADVPVSYGSAPQYDQAWILASGYRDNAPGVHSVTALVETAAARAVGGMDETLTAWEDWEFFLHLAAAGYCGVAVDVPTIVYRLATGHRRAIGQRQKQRLMRTLERRYGGYANKKETPMACCGGNAATKRAVAQRLAAGDQAAHDTQTLATMPVRMRYIGPLVGEHTVVARPSGTAYRVGNNPFNRYFDVDPADVAYLTSLETIEVVRG